MNTVSGNFNNAYRNVNPSITFKNTAAYQYPEAMQEVQIPEMYANADNYRKPENLKDTIKKVDVMGMVTNWMENPLLSLGITFGVFKGFDVLSNSFGGEYEKSTLGKAAAFGDRIQNSKLIQSKECQGIIKPIKNFWGRTKTYLHKNSITSAMLDNPARPDWDMPRTEMYSQKMRIIQDFQEFAHKLNIENNESLLNEMKLTKEEFQTIMKDKTGSSADLLEKALGNTKHKLEATKGEIKWFGKFQPFKRKITGEQFYNRLHSLSSPKTGTGKFCAKAMQILHRMATFGGGKAALLVFMVPHLVSTVKNVQKADSDSKIGTLANGILMAGAWVVTFPLAVKALFSVGGLQNIGVSKDKVAKIRELTDGFNDKVKNNGFKTSNEYKTAKDAVKKQIKDLKHVDGQNLLVKILRKVGSFVDIGNSNLKGRNFFQKIPSFSKNLIGAPMRFIIGGFVLQAFFDGIIEKCCAAVFGKKYDEMKEEEHKANKEKQEEFTKQDLQRRLYEAQAAKVAQANNPKVINPKPIVKESPATPIIEEPVKEAAPEQNANTHSYVPNQSSTVQNVNAIKRDNYTYIPSQENVLKTDQAQQNKYIPSQLAANITKTFDNSNLKSAIKRADLAEKRAAQILSGNFAGYQN